MANERAPWNRYDNAREQRKRIAELHTEGLTVPQIADRLGCHIETVRRYVKLLKVMRDEN
ncbi:MAG: helix-turn-helix domain-containing protein [Pseudomonadota bacterium]